MRFQSIMLIGLGALALSACTKKEEVAATPPPPPKLDCALSGRSAMDRRARLIIYVETQDSRRSPQLPREGSATCRPREHPPEASSSRMPISRGRSAQQLTRPTKIDQTGQPLTTASYAGVWR